MALPAGAVLVLAPGPEESAARMGRRSERFSEKRLAPVPCVTY